MRVGQDSDIELGQINSVRVSPPPNIRACHNTKVKRIWSKLTAYLLALRNRICAQTSGKCTASRILGYIENRPNGYPRFGALIASHDDFYLCRRFSELRARTLLLKQDKLSRLEKRLQTIDRNEREVLYLGSCRADKSSEREVVLSHIDNALMDYDEYIIRNRQILELEEARPQAVTSLRNWTAGNPCVARAETAYLNRSGDLLSVAPTDDTVMAWITTVIEKFWIWLRLVLGLKQSFDVSRDPKVHIMPQVSITRAARVLMTPFIVTLLLAPVVICNCVESRTARLIIIVTAASMFIAVLSGSTRAKTTELVVAGATYTTVLIVFITSTNDALQQQGLDTHSTTTS